MTQAQREQAEVVIVGAGIAGLTLALCLDGRGISCRLFEAVPRIEPLGVGINLLPHAMRELTELGLSERLLAAGIETREVRFYNRFGQLIHTDPRGRYAGYEWPQVSLHRGALQQVLLDAVKARLGEDAVQTGWRYLCATQDAQGVHARLAHAGDDSTETRTVSAKVLVGCDGLHSAVRRQLHPGDDPLVYSGITMWRGVTRWPAFLTGATMAYAGWLETGKAIVYPIGDGGVDRRGRPLRLTNWLCEFHVPPRRPDGNWSQPGQLDDFLGRFEEMRFDWLDLPALVRAADFVYEYPMVDRDPLPRWTEGCITLLGDAAHPMTPRGSNGAGQAVLDARRLSDEIASLGAAGPALRAYEAVRRPATEQVVIANRTDPPDAILREVFLRTGDQPFKERAAVISDEELAALSQGYKQVAGFDRESLASRRN